MRLIELKSENIKRISAVELSFDPDKGLFVIGGRNAQGKTSVLDSIEMVLRGGKMPDKPIRDGQDKAVIVAKLEGDADKGLMPMTVTRRFTKNGSTLEIQAEGKYKMTKPQQILDDLFSRFTFDPLEFTRQKPDKQVETLKQLVGLDFTALDQRRAGLFNTRTDVNRTVKDLTSRINGVPLHTDVPAEEVSVAELMEELQRREQTQLENAEQRKRLQSCTQAVVDHDADINRIEQEIENLQKQLGEKRDAIAEAEKQRDTLASEVKALKDPDVEEVRRKISQADQVNARVRSNQQRHVMEAELHDAEKKAADLTQQIDEIDVEKENLLSSAKWPIEGLGFDGAQVSYNGIPFSQVSSAEQLRISVAMGFASNPTLPLILCRDGSLLDDDSLKAMAEEAEKHGGQIIMERVGSGQECSVIIEDGKVQEPEKAASAKPKGKGGGKQQTLA